MTNDELLESIFFQYDLENRNLLVNNADIDLAYYTSLEVLHYILTDGKIWLRNINCMNDYTEVLWSKNLIFNSIGTFGRLEKLASFFKIFDADIDWKDRLNKLIVDMPISMMYNAYITSFTVQRKMNDYGRLSMWRGYGRHVGGLLVFDKNKILQRDIEGIWLSKVGYFNQKKFDEQIDKIIFTFQKDIDKLRERKISAENIWDVFQRAIIFSLISVKHPGFEEEKEWRLICFNNMSHDSNYISSETKVVNGIPQKIFMLNIKKILPDILQKVIVGPTQYKITIRDAIKEDILALYSGQVYLPERLIQEKLKFSDITIRPELL